VEGRHALGRITIVEHSGWRLGVGRAMMIPMLSSSSSICWTVRRISDVHANNIKQMTCDITVTGSDAHSY
jgi:hypothetical protein